MAMSNFLGSLGKALNGRAGDTKGLATRGPGNPSTFPGFLAIEIG